MYLKLFARRPETFDTRSSPSLSVVARGGLAPRRVSDEPAVWTSSTVGGSQRPGHKEGMGTSQEVAWTEHLKVRHISSLTSLSRANH